VAGGIVHTRSNTRRLVIAIGYSLIAIG